eukprot:tig00000849_g4781.t1
MATRRPPSAGMQRASSMADADLAPARRVERTLSQPGVREPVAASSAVTRLDGNFEDEDDDSDDDDEILEAARRRSDLGWVNKDVDFTQPTRQQPQQRTQTQQGRQPVEHEEPTAPPPQAHARAVPAPAAVTQPAARATQAHRATARPAPQDQEPGSDEADVGDGDDGGADEADETERSGHVPVADAGAPSGGAAAGPPLVLSAFPQANNQAALREWLLRPVPKGETVQSMMIRKYAPLVKKLFPSFQLFPDDSRRLLLHVKRKKLDKQATYPFFTEKTKSKSKSSTESYMGKMRVLNAVCTDFVLYDRGERRAGGEEGDDDGDEAGSRRHELAAIHFKEHKVPLFARAREPRCMHVLIPVVHEDGRREEHACRPAGQPGLIDRLKEAVNTEGVAQPRGPFVLLQTAQPIWNPQRRSHVLDFGGRVKIASLKNFQLVLAGSTPEGTGATDGSGPGAPVLPRHPWVMQFGKTSSNEFALDFRFPLCPLQAMGIALTTMHAGTLLDYR